MKGLSKVVFMSGVIWRMAEAEILFDSVHVSLFKKM